MGRVSTAGTIGAALTCVLATTQVATAVDLTLGAGIATAPDYEGSDDNEAVPFWNLRAGDLYHPETYVQLVGSRLLSNFVPDDHWRLGLAGQFIKKRDDVDNDQVDDLENVDASLMLGVVAGYDFFTTLQNDLVLEFEARQDIANDNGFQGTLRGRYGHLFAGRWRFDGLVATTYAGDDYMNSYFSIDADDAARSGLDEFDADAGFKDVTLGASLTYRFLGNWSATGTGTYTRLIGDAEDSPVVDDVGDKDNVFAGFLINYRL